MADEGTQVASVAACAWPIGVTANVAGPVSTSRAGEISDGLYSYSLATTGLSKGTWSLRVAVNDGTTHTTSITLK